MDQAGVTVGAILLAGGRASRMDGAAKPLVEVGGATLLAHAVAAARSLGSAPIVAVGPPLADLAGVTWTREDPPFGGPAAGVVAGLRAFGDASPEWTLVLACDLPRAEQAVALLAEAAAVGPADLDGVCLADAGSRPQWLTALYRTAPLRARAERLPDAGRDAPARSLADEAAIMVLSDPDGRSTDVDTWDDLEKETRR
ncbi:NTP transferase domain-containing protein [Microbacterium sp. X-17]|uniref:molybdenum cofactor guanylyltransferase n=1 Tax=Microbacterium sp. X-17 TaxID=3144404 RepID=UPI0031F52AD6